MKRRKGRSVHLHPRTEPLEPAVRTEPYTYSFETGTVATRPARMYQPSPLLDPKHVVVYGSSLCICCTRLRRALEVEGWRYRWAEIKGKNAIRQLQRMFPDWKGGLPVIVIEGKWLEVKSTHEGELSFSPWPIPNPKKRRYIPLEE